MYRIISTGSKGNAILYHGSILVDIGVPFSLIKEFQYSIKLVLLTHEHGDHINTSTLRKLADNRPTLRVACGEWMLNKLQGIKLRNIDILETGKVYDYGTFQISPITLFHDVQNFGFRIFKGNHKTIHATDTATLEGIEAKDYDLYAIESNYNEDTVFDTINSLKEKGQFAYQTGAVNSHLSEQAARDFIYKNAGPNSQVLRLHETSLI